MTQPGWPVRQPQIQAWQQAICYYLTVQKICILCKSSHSGENMLGRID